MPIIKRLNRYQGLRDIDVFIEEKGLNSEYFNVTGMPVEVPQGKSSFLVGGSPFLKNNIEIKIEMLDSAGQTIYMEPVSNYLESGARRVSIEVYPDTTPGIAKLYLVGELKRNFKDFQQPIAPSTEITDLPFSAPPQAFINSSQSDVPSNFQGVYNIRYEMPIQINTTIPNTEPILFYKQPRLTVREIVKGFVHESVPSSSYGVSGSLSINRIPESQPESPPPEPPDGQPAGLTESDRNDVGKGLSIFKNRRSFKRDPYRNSLFAKRGRVMRRSSPEVDKSSAIIKNVTSTPENDVDKITSTFVGETLHIDNITIDTSTLPYSVPYTMTGSYSTKVKSVLNDSTFVPIDDFTVTLANGEKYPANITNASFTASIHPTPGFLVSNTEFRSFADITIGNLRTFSGDVYKAIVYGKSKGSLGDFEPMYEAFIESSEVLIDKLSPTGFTSTAYFYTQSIVDAYWDVTDGTAIESDEVIIDGVTISGSNYAADKFVKFSTKHVYDLEPNVAYNVQFNTYYYKAATINPNNTTEVINDAVLEVYVTGSKAGNKELLGRVNVGEASEGKIDSIFKTFISAPISVPKMALEFHVKAGRFILQDLSVRPMSETNFNPDYHRVIVPMPHPLPVKPDTYDFVVELFDVNNNLAETFANEENVEFTGAPIIISGPGNFLSGSMMLGTGMELYGGSAFLRTTGYRGMKHAIANNKGGFMVWSGSIGDGATKNLITASAGDVYDGVGLDIIDAHDSNNIRFLKFGTNPSKFEVITDTFYFGKQRNQPNSQFVSGSSGNIEISSSAFHLDTKNNIMKISGSITASTAMIGRSDGPHVSFDGTNINMSSSVFMLGDKGTSFVSGSDGKIEISSSFFHLTPTGDVTGSAILLGSKTDNNYLQYTTGSGLVVKGDLAVDQIFTPAEIGGLPSTITNASSSITSDGFAKFTSASIAGFEVSTDEIKSGNNSLRLKSSGQMSGSSILLGVKPDNFLQFANNTLTVRGDLSVDQLFLPATIDGATSNVTNASSSLTSDGFAKFVSASIGGWNVSTTNISSPGGNIELDSTNNQFKVISGNERIRIGEVDTSEFGMKVFDGTGVTDDDILVELGEGGNTIAGWNIGSQTLEGGDLILSKDGSIRSRGYQSDVAGSGFILTAASGGFLEVENAKIRGTLATAVFEKESVNAVGGQLYVANSTTLTASLVAPDGIHTATQQTMSVVNASGFSNGEILTIKKVHQTGFNTEYLLVNSSSRNDPTSDNDQSGLIFVTRGYGQGTSGDSGSLGGPAGSATSYSGSQVIVSTGKVGTGYIRLNANPNDQATPYMDIVERTGAGLYDVELKARLGDLSGVAGSRNVPLGFTGFGLMSEVAFLSGSMIKLESPEFILGDKNRNFVSGSSGNLEISSSNFHFKPNGDFLIGKTAISSSVSVPYYNTVNTSLGTDHLLAHYTFDNAGTLSDGGTIVDQSASSGSNNLTVEIGGVGAAAVQDGVNAIIGHHSVAFTGGDTNLTNRASFYKVNPFGTTRQYVHELSLAIWFKSTDVSEEQLIFSVSNIYTGLVLVITGYETLQGNAYRNNGGNGNQMVLEGGTLDSDRWYHVVLTFDKPNNALKLYLDGVLVDNSTLVSNLSTYGLGSNNATYKFYKTDIQIGGVGLSTAESGFKLVNNNTTSHADRYSQGQRSLQGSVDDARVYHSVLSAANVTTLYNTGSLVSPVTTTVTSPSLEYDNATSDFKVNTRTFTLGLPNTSTTTSNVAFISGSGGKMEISSSNFHLKEDGNVIMSGNVTADSGNIGGWIVGSTLSATNIVLNPAGPNIQLAGKTTFADNNVDGVYIGTEGIAIGNDNEFTVTNAGAVTATSATITGEINATSGNFSGNLTSTAIITGGTIRTADETSGTGKSVKIDGSNNVLEFHGDLVKYNSSATDIPGRLFVLDDSQILGGASSTGISNSGMPGMKFFGIDANTSTYDGATDAGTTNAKIYGGAYIPYTFGENYTDFNTMLTGHALGVYRGQLGQMKLSDGGDYGQQTPYVYSLAGLTVNTTNASPSSPHNSKGNPTGHGGTSTSGSGANAMMMSFQSNNIISRPNIGFHFPNTNTGISGTGINKPARAVSGGNNIRHPGSRGSGYNYFKNYEFTSIDVGNRAQDQLSAMNNRSRYYQWTDDEDDTLNITKSTGPTSVYFRLEDQYTQAINPAFDGGSGHPNIDGVVRTPQNLSSTLWSNVRYMAYRIRIKTVTNSGSVGVTVKITMRWGSDASTEFFSETIFTGVTSMFTSYANYSAEHSHITTPKWNDTAPVGSDASPSPEAPRVYLKIEGASHQAITVRVDFNENGGTNDTYFYAFGDGNENSRVEDCALKGVDVVNTIEAKNSNVDGIRYTGFFGADHTGLYSRIRSTTGTVYGVYSQTNDTGAVYSIHNEANTGADVYAGYFAGNVRATGHLSYGTTGAISDERLKEDITLVSGSLEIINKLKPSRFKWKSDYKYEMDPSLSGKQDIGLIAQEVEDVLPELIFENSIPEKDFDLDLLKSQQGKYKGKKSSDFHKTFKFVKYDKLVPLLVEAIQEQQKQIEKLTEKIEELEEK